MGTVTVQGRDELGRLIDVTLATAADVAPPGPEVVTGSGGAIAVTGAVGGSIAGVTTLITAGTPTGAAGEATLAGAEWMIPDDDAQSLAIEGTVVIAPNDSRTLLQLDAAVGQAGQIMSVNQGDDAEVFEIGATGNLKVKPGGEDRLTVTANDISLDGGGTASVYIDGTNIELNAVVVMAPSLPTVDPGVTGQLWNDNDVLKVSSP